MFTTGKIIEGRDGSSGLDIKALLSGALGGNLLSKNNVNVEEIANQVIDVISESESKQNI